MRKFLTVCAALVLFMAFGHAEVTVDLGNMTQKELVALQEAIAHELESNHKTNSSEEEKVLEAVKQAVESAFSQRGIDISWAWINYDYTKDWNYYTLTTHIDYRDSENRKQKPSVYGEVLDNGNSYVLEYLSVGEEVLYDNRAHLPADLKKSANLDTTYKSEGANEKAPSAFVQAPVSTAVPAKAIKVTAEQLINAYENNEVKADAMYKDKLITVTGKVGDISVMFGETIVEVGTGSLFEFGIQCYFADAQESQVAQLNKKDRVTITGQCEGKSFMSVSLKNCSLGGQ